MDPRLWKQEMHEMQGRARNLSAPSVYGDYGSATNLAAAMAPPSLRSQQSLYSLAQQQQVMVGGEHLELALLHAAPLVWTHKEPGKAAQIAPLDHHSLAIDFKSEVREMWGILNRTKKQVNVRFDIATAAFLGEMLALKPAALHLVCHADFEPHKREQGASDEEAFFLGLEDADGALDLLDLRRLKVLLAPALVRSTRLVFVSACHSQPAAEVFCEVF